jgi:transcriptional regulator with XRE-family HTH domain
MSLREMQAKTGLDRGHLSRMERGLVGASDDAIRRYAEALDVPTAAITHDR